MLCKVGVSFWPFTKSLFHFFMSLLQYDFDQQELKTFSCLMKNMLACFTMSLIISDIGRNIEKVKLLPVMCLSHCGSRFRNILQLLSQEVFIISDIYQTEQFHLSVHILIGV